MAQHLFTLRKVAMRPVRNLKSTGRQAEFYLHSYRAIPWAVRRYRHEVVRLLGEISLGAGPLALIGGTVVIVGLMTSFAGLEIGILGYTQLEGIGVHALTGFVSAYGNTRETAPIIAGVALVATVGAGFTAQIGSMRISEEIDALEVMAVRSIPFLVSTRIIAGVVAIIPLYAVALIMSYAASRLVVVFYFEQPVGTYDHYFSQFLIPMDVYFSLLKVAVMAMVVMSVHCYYGFTASGGPAGVGAAVGKAVRLSLVVIMIVNMAMSLVLYGNTETLRISG